MSVKASAWAWRQTTCGDVPLRGNLKLVLLALADHSDSDGWSFPKRKTIAKKVGVSPKTVTDLLAQLELGGLVRREPHFVDVDGEQQGQQTSNDYLLSMKDPPPPKPRRRVRGGEQDGSCSAGSHEPSGQPPGEPGSTSGNVARLPARGRRRSYDEVIR